MRAARVILLAGTLVALGLSAQALAGKTFNTKVEFDTFCDGALCGDIPEDESKFLGTVVSPKRACEAGRRVNVYEAIPGEPRRLLGFDFADSHGHWYLQRRYNAVGFAGFAKAPRLALGNGESCKPARSETLAD